MALNYEGHEATTEPFSGSAEGPLASEPDGFLGALCVLCSSSCEFAQLVNFTGNK